MTTLECLRYLMDCTGDVESEDADPELKEACLKIKEILSRHIDEDPVAFANAIHRRLNEGW